MADGKAQVRAADLWCRRCGGPLRLEGSTDAAPEFRKAVHADTGREAGADGHLAAPAELTISEVRDRYPERVIRRDGFTWVAMDPTGLLAPAESGRLDLLNAMLGDGAGEGR